MLERQLTRLNAARASIADRMGAPCETAIVLGTGLGQLADAVSDPVFIPYTEIAGFPVSSAPSHKGRLVIGDLFGRRTVMMQGRVHLYEGWSARDIALAIYLLKAFGPKRLVITNAAGGLNPRLRAGDIMLIEGCITPMLGRHGMMVGAPREAVGGTAAGSGVFTASEEIVARALARRLSLTRGVYAAVTGPSYETRAEIRMLRRLGADAVGMSTWLEAVEGARCGMRVAGLSLITNVLTDASRVMLDHGEVVEQGRIGAERMRIAIDAALMAMQDSKGNIQMGDGV